jgi:DNA-binding NtrC family response regulator
MDYSGTILIVDDDALVLEALVEIFSDEYLVVSASSGQEALQTLEGHDDLDAIILDIKMAEMDGLQTASRIKEMDPDVPIIFHTGYPGEYSEGDIEKDIRPFDYVGKDERPARLHRAVRQAVTFHQLKKRSISLADHARTHFGMVGRSQAMLNVYETIVKIAPTNNKVIIYGATGTGKELVARAIHKMSQRVDKRLVICSCSHRPPDLVGAELFGHLRGSFTGAMADRVGLFEYADRGTLFLDEIGDLDLTTQGKVLRVLETGELQRIGSPETITVDVRVICATHRDLQAMVAEGAFREDLYYRLKGVTISLPRLRERPEDIPELIDYFIENHCRREGIGLKVFEPSARNLLVEFGWPGNVRQLMDTVQSLIDLTPSHFITGQEAADYLSYAGLSVNSDHSSFSEQVRDFKKTRLIQALDRNNYNVSATARELSIDPSNLRKIVKDFQIPTDQNSSSRE